MIITLTGCMAKVSPTPEPAVNAEPEDVQVFNAEVAEPTVEPEPALPPEPAQETVPQPTPYTPPVIENIPSGVANPFNTKYGSPFNDDGSLKNDLMAWWFGKNKNLQPPTATQDFDIRQFDGYYLGDITSKVLYLTFDEGYENGFTPAILDILKEKNVPAAFFMTKPFITGNPELCKRMVEEGHIAANHTVSHKPSHTLTDDEFRYELEETARAFKESTGYDMGMYFRPPEGVYSARVLSLAKEMGYKTVFWSFAYEDWNRDKQPGKQAAFDQITQYYHNGCVILLHAVSESNTQALGDAIDYLRGQGYEFKSLNELPVY
jgi:peptidoglycan-N-acetylmuramic acid deacetylase